MGQLNRENQDAKLNNQNQTFGKDGQQQQNIQQDQKLKSSSVEDEDMDDINDIEDEDVGNDEDLETSNVNPKKGNSQKFSSKH